MMIISKVHISDIIRAITDATVDRANRDINTNAINWEYVLEDVKYLFRNEIKESAEVEMTIVSEFFAFRQEFEKQK